MTTLTLYMKAECHLCHDARLLLEQIAGDLAFSFIEVDITQDEALYERFRESIPVVAVAGRVLLEAPITETHARKVLRAALK